MPVLKDASGKRWVQAETEVPGTPAEVWRAVATGPGISSWFVPSQVEERVGGAVTANFGPGMDSAAVITAWEPPRRFVAESQDLGPNAPAVISEWIVEPRSAQTCTVRVVHSVVTDSKDWDSALHGWETGWPAFFRILNVYLKNFSGEPCSAMQLMGAASGSASGAWNKLTTSLGIKQPQAGEKCSTRSDAPVLSGIVERATSGQHCELLVRLAAPAPGIAHFFAMPMGGQVLLPLRFYLYGEKGSAAVTGAESSWRKWMDEHFPMTPPSS